MKLLIVIAESNIVNLRGCKPRRALQQPFHSFQMMIYAVTVFIQQAYIHTNCFKKPFGQCIAIVMQYVFVKTPMAIQGMWPKTMQ